MGISPPLASFFKVLKDTQILILNTTERQIEREKDEKQTQTIEGTLHHVFYSYLFL
jgi:hypothetical protein